MSIAFKEWQVVCDALASGRQSILLRKGGIHEGRAGFSFAHERFYLFPTKFHAQAGYVREGDFTPEREWQVGDSLRITHHAVASFAVTLTDWAQLEALGPYHIYTEETLRERFDWEGKGMASGSIHLALVRVSKLESPLELTYEKRFGGCRSWLELEPPDPENALPVLTQDVFSALSDTISRIAGSSASP
ncbi:DUF1802 family protein [Akkermansiaceae bacterium]|nr:DUF1802 family protein [Akkermansiaceae bacterium]